MSDITKPIISSELTIKEDVHQLLLTFMCEINDVNTRQNIVSKLSQYFKAKLPRDTFTFTDVTKSKHIFNNGYKIMVKTPYADARTNGEMELHAFLEFITDLESSRKLSKQYVSHLMSLSCYVSETLRLQGKTWEDLNVAFNRNDCETWIGGAASELTLRDLTTIEMVLDVNLIRSYTDKELGLTRQIEE